MNINIQNIVMVIVLITILSYTLKIANKILKIFSSLIFLAILLVKMHGFQILNTFIK